MSDDPQTVTYPLRDELREIRDSIKDVGRDVNTRFDKMERQLSQKADRADVVGIEGRVKVLELERAERVKAREVNAEHRSRSVDSRRTNWAMAVGGLAALTTIAELILQASGH